MTEIQATIKNDAGIHCRPTAVISQQAGAYKGRVFVETAFGSCKLGSALELMMLGLALGTEITLRIDGPDEDATAQQFKELFETEFDFPDAGK